MTRCRGGEADSPAIFCPPFSNIQQREQNRPSSSPASERGVLSCVPQPPALPHRSPCSLVLEKNKEAQQGPTVGTVEVTGQPVAVTVLSLE